MRESEREREREKVNERDLTLYFAATTDSLVRLTSDSVVRLCLSSFFPLFSLPFSESKSRVDGKLRTRHRTWAELTLTDTRTERAILRNGSGTE